MVWSCLWKCRREGEMDDLNVQTARVKFKEGKEGGIGDENHLRFNKILKQMI